MKKDAHTEEGVGIFRTYNDKRHGEFDIHGINWKKGYAVISLPNEIVLWMSEEDLGRI